MCPDQTSRLKCPQQTRTRRRKSADYRLARRVRMQGQHPVNAEDIIATSTLANGSMFIDEDRSVIVLAREWGIGLLCNAERVCIDGTFRSALVTHFQMLSFHVLCKNRSSLPNRPRTSQGQTLCLIRESAGRNTTVRNGTGHMSCVLPEHTDHHNGL